MGATGDAGTFIGHAVPAAFFLALGVILLLLSLQRAHNLHPDQTFCEAHVPEKNKFFLKLVAMFVMCGAVTGILLEGGKPTTYELTSKPLTLRGGGRVSERCRNNRP